MNRVIYSFVVDRGSKFPYQAWHLAHSLMRFSEARPNDIHIQFTPAADPEARELLASHGFVTHTLTPYGDRTYCNKLAQIQNLPCEHAEVVVLLDTDTIAVADLRRGMSAQAIRAKIVDLPNPPISALREIAALANLNPGEICLTDAGEEETFVGNCNGGMYAIPGRLAGALSDEWRRWASWLIEHPEPLRRVDREIHVDQVSFWMALRSTQLPFEIAPANLNYFTHFASRRRYFDDNRPIELLHYHNTLNVLGKLDVAPGLEAISEQAIACANEQIGTKYNNRLFWEFRYEHFPERGSGLGSRGSNLTYKRELLLANDIEQTASVLDIGCGDLEIIKTLKLHNYTGVDMSPLAITRGRQILPNASFSLGTHADTPAADLVLCLEVLIHQHDEAEYSRLLAFAAERTNRALIVSGYAANTPAIESNPMVFFHEPLADSLSRLGRFRSIAEIGRHSDVVIYRCDV